MADTNKSYTGRIANTGSQIVKAPDQSAKKGTGKVKTGADLRTGKK